MEDHEIVILEKFKSGKCTPLEMFNAKMYFGLQIVGTDGLRRAYGLNHTEEEKNESDIWIGKWPDGIHYYAKVKGIDVVDRNGNVKWNTYKAATEAVEYFNSHIQ